MLKFIGSGSAFNTTLGNNGAFIEEENLLFLIDCGSSTFERLRRYKKYNNKSVFDDKNKITVLITHLHPDHIGSLGDLIFYSYYAIKVEIMIICPTIHMMNNLEAILNSMGVSQEMYDKYIIPYQSKIGLTLYGKEHVHEMTIEPIKTSHDSDIECYGYFIDYKDESVYYSGDSSGVPNCVISALEYGDISKLYQDTSKLDYEGNVHLSLRKLTEMIKPELRDRVWCMHMDESFNKSEAVDLGFNVVQSVLERSFWYCQPKKTMVYGIDLKQAKEKLIELYEELVSQGATFAQRGKDYFITADGWKHIAVSAEPYARAHKASVAYVSEDISLRTYHELILPTLSMANDPIIKFY